MIIDTTTLIEMFDWRKVLAMREYLAQFTGYFESSYVKRKFVQNTADTGWLCLKWSFNGLRFMEHAMIEHCSYVEN